MLPLIVAPMNKVSSVELVAAACQAGAIGAFPTHNAGDLERALRRLLGQINSGHAPLAANLIVHRTNTRRDADLQVLVAHRVELVLTSVGNPAPVVAPLQAAGCLVFADVASIRHAHQALECGVDGLVLLSAGAAGQTGWLNPIAFVRAVRQFFDGPIVLAGGVSDGASLPRRWWPAPISHIWERGLSPPRRAPPRLRTRPHFYVPHPTTWS